jgi:hypothetical protein
MSESESRRDFLRRMALGGLAMGVQDLAADTDTGASEAIRKIKPLGRHWETSDPFLYCVHNEDSFPAGNDAMGPSASLQGREIGQDFAGRDGWRMYHGETVPGFPGHPHRGFETVTVVRKGMVDQSGASWTLPAARAGVNRTLYFFAGAGLSIEGVTIPAKHAIELRGDAEARLLCGKQDCEMLLLQGRPIGEPVAQHGPFVMNTDAEIGQAFGDYRKTRFGGWPWPTHEPVHPREKGRFARHSDGTETILPG